MDKIYLKDNYIVTELSGITAVFPKNYSSYSESSTGFYINSTFPVNNQRTVYIDFTRVTSVYNEAGTVAYSIATLRSFLLLNTGFKSPSGGSGGSTITVGTTPVTSGTDGRVFFQSGGVVQQDSSFFWDNTNKRLILGTTGINGELQINRSTGGTNIGGVRANSAGSGAEIGGANNYTNKILLHNAQGIHFFTGTNTSDSSEKMRITTGASWGLVIGATTNGARLDVRAQGALSTDIAFRVRNSADTQDLFYVTGAGGVFSHGKTGITTNLVYGSNTALQFASAAANNICIGNGLRLHTAGSRNVAIGNSNVLDSNGDDCVAVGHAAGSGGANQSTLIGSGGSGNFIRSTKVGFNAALYCAATDSVFLGNSAGANFGSSGGFNTANTQSVLIGVNSKTLANSDVNEIVIGFNTTGAGSNTATLGNTSITRTNLRGQVVISGFASAPTGVEGAIYYDSTTKKHYGFDGTTWNALY